MNSHLWLILVLPLAGAVLVGLFGKWLKGQSHWPVILAAIGACGISLHALWQLHSRHESAALLQTTVLPWFSAGGVNVGLRLAIDPLSAVMLTAITFIGTWIAIYSAGYMHGDPGYPRYFAVFSGFVFSMCGLVMTDNLLALYGFWEGVGLCSYLLIGFWFAKPSAAAAARKAFLVTRLGDAGFALGIFFLWSQFGTLDMPALFAAVRQQPNETVITTACLLLLCGAVGKSAQFPLHVWLPDAMEGPTPASALIHAATMVTAGVYLVGRCMPLYVLAPTALVVVAAIGALTALLAALIALTQFDLKRVMAYSTVSQLGYMFAALGCGQGKLAAFAVTAAIFHLFTHAFFKALLFLASGSVMHAMGGVIDMRRIGGLRKALPITHFTFACGAYALAGLPPLSGFWSKDEILAAANGAMKGDVCATVYALVFSGLILTALLTAFYTSRAYYLTFWGEEKIPAEAGSHGHDHHGESHSPGVARESPPVMTLPLVVLSVGAVMVGGMLALTHAFAHFVGKTPDFVRYHLLHEHEANIALMAGSAAIAIIGIAAGYFVYVVRTGTAEIVAHKIPVLYRLSLNRFYFDEIYAAVAAGPLVALAVVSKVFDVLIDGIVDLVGRLPRLFGGWLRPVQNGLVQFYALAMLFGLIVFIGILAFAR
jgi:NADH-quinone oxidoreductase subunit L